ncbi:Endonuclease/exonuclease/phosphatase [Mycena floridula]|nr:Endonuclease/exonuclease/phosphatase [Mycena floridula]
MKSVLGLAFAAVPTLAGTFSVLSYNVAGLPEGLSSGNPEVDTPLISPRLGPYSLVNVQEDFNYHAALYADDNHAFRTPTSGGAAIGSGLNTLSDFPYIDLERVKWDDCNLNDGDCLTPKGFLFTRIRVADGLYVDLYDLHADAGSDDGDRSARASNFEQLTEFINTWSAGMPVIVAGDTNSRYTSIVDSDSLHSFSSNLGLTDSWVKNARAGVYPVEGTDALTCPFPFPAGTTQATMLACEVVDKILTRGSTVVTLTTTAFSNENDAFVDSAGAPLSDHYPIKSVISWTLSSSIRLADPVGGPHGDVFNDIPALLTGKSAPKITSITIRSGSRLDSVQYSVVYPNGSTASASHGGTGGTATTLTMNAGEAVIQITMCEGQKDGDTRVFSISFLTNLGRTLAGGVTTSDCATSTIPTDAGSGGAWGLVSFWGRSGDEMDRLGGIWGASY